MRRREKATDSAPDRIERAGDGFHARIRDGFLRIARENPSRVVAIDASGSPDEVWSRIESAVLLTGRTEYRKISPEKL